MADEYTPTTEQVRAFALGFGGMRSPEHWDNWLAAHDRATAARAWDEGAEAGYLDCESTYEGRTNFEAVNPYREEDRRG